MYFVGSKSLTWPPKVVLNPLASKEEIGPMPPFPATMLAHADGTSLPTGVTRPNPVTTTRRLVTVLFLIVWI
jgi:hypothetical protein